MKFHMIAIKSYFVIGRRIFRKVSEQTATNPEGEICHFGPDESIEMHRETILATVQAQ